ncbi:hypothetical protein EYZ11_007465 [Aspergillus tanneri]|uniref:G-patch domain-containing protein n=1 Tax=Aspergillus tanneri TaxID=1220188 RepID=A0A4S3JF95_9EURO|nr:uncharacterized protein ATNIH1004_011151 [Aspergillus tanneri]KAA8642210.1 hypothetical protein ATNIH1004_011151 [Aspergillus tanneri]THC93068.1 hypothetical protein EYZ11_007465 [Aspergillus tanneri]
MTSRLDPARGSKEEEDEGEDYMSMVIEEPVQKETFAQKKRRLQREAEARAKVPSKAERAAQESARRDVALSTSTLDPSNKGFQMMAKLGFKPGQALGKEPTDNQAPDHDQDQGRNHDSSCPSRVEPLNLVFKEGRGGIGLDSEKKRKFREQAEDAVKKVKQEEGDYRDRVRLDRETRHTEAQFQAAQKVAERLDTEADADTDADADSDGRTKVRPTNQINLLYRGLVRDREERERSLHERHRLQSELPSSFFPSPRLPGYDDAALDGDDQEALGRKPLDLSSILEQEVDQEDPELDEFNALEPSERLARIVRYLRETHRYCFWCKFRYGDDAMEGCPGLTEEDHD